MTQPYTNMVPEIQAMRAEVAALAREESDPVSYGAYLLQARSLKTMEERVTSLRHDADARATREHLYEPRFCEQYYTEMLADWLESHLRHTRANIEGGESDAANSTGLKGDALAKVRLAAARHVGMTEVFCTSYAASLRQRSEELDTEYRQFIAAKAEANRFRTF